MTNQEIEFKMKSLVREERKITTEILSLINLAEDRKLHLQRGFSSLFDWLVRGFGYSESAAYRRIEAARLVRVVPEASAKLESGDVSLTTLAKARGAIRSQEKISGKKLSKNQQAEVVRNIENKSSSQADATLFSMFPETASSVHKEHQKVVSDSETRFSFNMDAEAVANLQWVKAYLSHSIPDGETAKIFARLLKEFRDRNEKKDTSAAKRQRVSETGMVKEAGATGAASAKSAVGACTTGKGRSLGKMAVKRVSLFRAQRRCEYVDKVTGRACGATYMVETDHISPKALGGEDKLENYRCLCRAHNQLEAERKLGIYLANAWQRDRRNRSQSPG